MKKKNKIQNNKINNQKNKNKKLEKLENHNPN